MMICRLALLYLLGVSTSAFKPVSVQTSRSSSISPGVCDGDDDDDDDKYNEILKKIAALTQVIQQLQQLDTPDVPYQQWLDVQEKQTLARLEADAAELKLKQPKVDKMPDKTKYEKQKKVIETKELDIMKQKTELLNGFHELLLSNYTVSSETLIDAMACAINLLELKEKETQVQMLNTMLAHAHDTGRPLANLQGMFDGESKEVELLQQIANINFQIHGAQDPGNAALRRQVVQLEIEMKKLNIQQLNAKLPESMRQPIE
jgi:hypothetical protein